MLHKYPHTCIMYMYMVLMYKFCVFSHMYIFNHLNNNILHNYIYPHTRQCSCTCVHTQPCVVMKFQCSCTCVHTQPCVVMSTTAITSLFTYITEQILLGDYIVKAVAFPPNVPYVLPFLLFSSSSPAFLFFFSFTEVIT